MAVERDALRDWHRLFGLLLADFFTLYSNKFLAAHEEFIILRPSELHHSRGRSAGPSPSGGLRRLSCTDATFAPSQLTHALAATQSEHGSQAEQRRENMKGRIGFDKLQKCV